MFPCNSNKNCVIKMLHLPAAKEKKSSARTMAHYTVQLRRDDRNCPISGEIRTAKITFKNFFFFFIVLINHDSILAWLEIVDNYSALLSSNEDQGVEIHCCYLLNPVHFELALSPLDFLHK